MAQKITLAEFEERLASVYGDCYEILEGSYSHLTASLTLLCKEHGEFSSTGNYLLLGFGCPECRPKKRGPRVYRGKYTHERLANESFQVYGDSLTVEPFDGEVKYDSLIKIRCARHGTFKRGIKPHLKGKNVVIALMRIASCPLKSFLRELIRLITISTTMRKIVGRA